MYQKNRNGILIVVTILAAAFYGCTKNWDNHNQVTDPNLNNNLAQAIKQNTNIGVFSSFLVKTGYDKIISSSKTYTVWAPTDQALLQLSPAIVNDTAQLKLFVANHISNQAYLMSAGNADQRIKMLNGKYILLSGNKFDSANVVTANLYASNGLYHVIDRFIPRYDNCWEFLNNTSGVPLMKTYLLSQNHIIFDPTIATQTGVDPNSGLPIYDSSTGKVQRNYFLDSVMNVSDETSQYTFVLLQDNSFTTELSKLTPWFKTSTTDSTTNLSSMFLVRDFAFKGLYTPDSLAKLQYVLMSQYGVSVPMTKSNIVASYKTSNGYVYVMSQVSIPLATKFPPIYIQGETPYAFSGPDRSANTFYRIRYNPVTQQNFNDIMLTNYGVANYFIDYFVRKLSSMRYNVSWVAVNDLQSTPLWVQQLKHGHTINHTIYYNATDTLTRVTIGYLNYNEVPLGQFSFSTYSDRNFYVFGPTTSSTAGNVDAITLDYIKLVPAF